MFFTRLETEGGKQIWVNPSHVTTVRDLPEGPILVCLDGEDWQVTESFDGVCKKIEDYLRMN